jgi:hypothetical protein
MYTFYFTFGKEKVVGDCMGLQSLILVLNFRCESSFETVQSAQIIYGST